MNKITVKVIQAQLPTKEMRMKFPNLPRSMRILAHNVNIYDEQRRRFIISIFYADSDEVGEGFMCHSKNDGVIAYKKFKVTEYEVLDDKYYFFNTLKEAEECLTSKNKCDSNCGHIYEVVNANQEVTLKFIVGWQGSKDEEVGVEFTTSYYFNRFDRKWEKLTKKVRSNFL